MSNCMKYGGKVKKMKKGGKVYSSGDPDSSPELDKKALEKSAEKRLKDVGNQKLNPPTNEGLKKLPEDVRNKMGYMRHGGKVHKMKSGGSVKKCKRDGVCVRGKTKGRMV